MRKKAEWSDLNIASRLRTCMTSAKVYCKVERNLLKGKSKRTIDQISIKFTNRLLHQTLWDIWRLQPRLRKPHLYRTLVRVLKLHYSISMKRSQESESTKWTRRLVVWVISAFVVFLGAPMFFYTTSIHRAALPVEELMHRRNNFLEAIAIQVPLYIQCEELLDVGSLQRQIDNVIKSEWGVDNSWRVNLKLASEHTPDPLKDYIVDIVIDGDKKPSMMPNTLMLTVHANCKDCVSKKLLEVLELIFKNEVDTILDVIHRRVLKVEHNEVAVPHSSTYNLVFNLFVEDGRAVDWEIDDAVSSIQPLLDLLKHYTSFKITSQVQYYSKLHNPTLFDNETNRYIIPTKDLSTFINYGDWNLIIHDVYPTINFIVFFPAANHKGYPLMLENSKTNSFIVPQWGGVYIYNSEMPVLDDYTYTLHQEKLAPIFDIFAYQLLELMGVPKDPKSLLMRVASFHRIMAMKNLKHLIENLSSLVTLSNSLDEISIPESTFAHMVDSLDFFDKAVECLKTGLFDSAMEYSSKGLISSDKAFFEKEMVQQAYFPSEHKLAVFLPLLGPLGAIVIFGLIGSLKEQAKEKREKKKELENKKKS